MLVTLKNRGGGIYKKIEKFTSIITDIHKDIYEAGYVNMVKRRIGKCIVKGKV
jgi:hypothetical protein